MSREDNIWFIVSVGTGILLGCVLGLWFAEIQPQQRLVYDYQAIIAGILALAAGLMTVFQMMRVDNRQADRQRELMSVQLRKDALILDRFRYEISALMTQANDLREVLSRFDSPSGILNNLVTIIEAAKRLSVSSSPERLTNYAKAADLLSAEFYEHMTKYSHIKTTIDARFSVVQNPMVASIEDRNVAFKDVLILMSEYEGCLADIFDYVTELRRKYIKATGLPLKDIKFVSRLSEDD